MIIALNIGNSQIGLGCLDEKNIYMKTRISTSLSKTAVEYAVLIKTIVEMNGIDLNEVTGSIIASVVPSLNNTFKEVMKMLTGVDAKVVGPGLKSGVNIHIDDPGELGAGMVVNAASAITKYEAPFVIVDLGTATTFSVINAKKQFIGGVIYPGVVMSYNALTRNTAQLPQISFDKPAKVIGGNSVDCMQSGMIYGNAAMINGVLDRIEEELGEKITVIATGDMGRGIIPYCIRDIVIDDDLTLEGMRIIYYRNIKK